MNKPVEISTTMYLMLLNLARYPSMKDFIGIGYFQLLLEVIKEYEQREKAKKNKIVPINPNLTIVKDKDNEKK